MFKIRQHKDDKDMLEIITEAVLGGLGGRILVWAVMNEDFFNSAIPDFNARQEFLCLIRSGEEVELELKKA